MSLHRVFDAAYPPASAPPGVQGVLGYVGAPGRTPHVWTLQEWLRFSHLVQFPCYVPDLGNNPDTEALTAVGAVLRLGWAPHEPDTRVIVLDGETAQFPGWYEKFAARVAGSGFAAVDYGSLSAVAGNYAADLWVADWDGDPNLLGEGQTIHGDQFSANLNYGGTQIDLSSVDDWLFARGGRGARKAA